MCQSYGVFWADLGIILKLNLEKNYCAISFSLCATEIHVRSGGKRRKKELTSESSLEGVTSRRKVQCVSTPRFPVWMFKIAALELKQHHQRIAFPRQHSPQSPGRPPWGEARVVIDAWDCSPGVYFQSAFLKHVAFLDSRPDSFLSSLLYSKKTDLFSKIYRTSMLSNALSKRGKRKSSDFESVQVQLGSLLICQLGRGEQFWGEEAINLFKIFLFICVCFCYS